MRKIRSVRWVPFFLAMLITLAGCAGSAQIQVREQSEDSVIRGQIMLANPESSVPERPHRAENPPADDMHALSAGDVQTAAVAPEAVPQPQVSGSDSSRQQSQASSSPTVPQQQPSAIEPSTQASASDSGADESLETVSALQEIPTQEMAVRTEPHRVPVADETRGVWISYLEMESLLTKKSESQFAANIGNVFDNVRNFGLNTVFVQVRPFADALYRSEYFPWSYLITGTEGQDPGFDPLAIMVEEAHSRGLRIEAWINPYRVRAANNKNALSSGNQARKWLDAGDNAVISYNGVISYNPASSKARELIVNGARELVRNYSVDGIHIDDYFYPSTDAAFDASSYNAYRGAGGTLTLADWRRSNVETLIKALYAAVKSEDPNAVFGISPQSSVNNNYSAQYLDVGKISANSGYCDYICPQIYFGFDNGTQPFLETLDSWDNMVNNAVVDLYVGVAAYKCGAVDNWAGGGKNEWINNTDLLKRMVEVSRARDSYAGFAIYRYESLFVPASSVSAHVQKEYANLKSIL